MLTTKNRMGIERLASSYFNKNVFPYWCVVLADTFIVFVSTAFVYWAFYRTGVTYEHRKGLLCTMLLFSVLSIIGARAFRTYSGVVRYSGFIDLLKVCYANALTFVLAIGSYYIFKYFGVDSLRALKPLQIFATFVLAAMLMLVMRMMVKTLYDLTRTSAVVSQLCIEICCMSIWSRRIGSMPIN